MGRERSVGATGWLTPHLASHSPASWLRISYFHCSLFGYFLGLLTATISSEVFKAAQPALLYLVPFTLIPLFGMAWIKGDLRSMWSDPFVHVPPAKYQAI